MLMNFTKYFVIGSGAGMILIAGNHYYVHDMWRSRHPLIQEAIDLSVKDKKIVRQIGSELERSGSISGVLDSDKRWASATFEVLGDVKAKVTVVADAKPQEEIKEDYFPIGPYDPPCSTFDWVLSKLSLRKIEKSNLRWRIVALSVKFDDLYVHNIIGEGLRSHKELKELEIIKNEDEDIVESDNALSVGNKRRRTVINRVSSIYWKMLLIGVISSFLGIYSFKFFKQFTVKNSLFLNKAIEMMRTEEIVRKEIGLPLNNMECIKGFLNHNKSKGFAKFFVHGPNGWGKVEITGKINKNTKAWEYSKIAMQKDGQTYEFIKSNN